ncbi:ATP-grasp domain-containing protein [Ktedonosporobacter rubrisoli]|uniref:carboxylate--amine ligase n=1 Tax=Ktedonosporobacter rubrisoli TaxID=2509675 RepID=UPI0013EEB9C6|nr:ATP-grasp domain-containing protein [Ktedonosporobacter rubrisoli]
MPTFSSRWCQHAYLAPEYEHDKESFLDYLKLLLSHTGARVLIASADGTLAVLREYRQELEALTYVALAKEAALEAAVNKTITLQIAQKLGLGIPRSVQISSVGEITEAIREIGLPAVIKPVESWLWGSDVQGELQGVRLISRLVTTPEEAREAIEEQTQFGGSALFQQFLAGRREAVNFMYANGEIYARFAQWARRTHPPLGGVSVYRQSIEIPSDIGEQAEKLVREIELEGYSEVEFRRDSEGKPYLMEINPRLSASIEVAVRAGVDFPYLLYQWASGEKIDRVMDYRIGGWMRFLEGDILTTIQALSQYGRPGVDSPEQAIFDFMAAFFVPSGYDYVDGKDLLPVWTAMRDVAFRARQKLASGMLRRTFR